MWTGCGQRAVYTTRKYGGLADWAITEIEALLDSFSFQRLNLSFSGTCSTHTVLGLYTWTVALPCRVPQGPGVDYSMGVIITSLIMQCCLQGCFQTQQGITASSSFLQMRNYVL